MNDLPWPTSPCCLRIAGALITLALPVVAGATCPVSSVQNASVLSPTLAPECQQPETNREQLQKLLDQPGPTILAMPEGEFCIDQPLAVGANTEIAGAGATAGTILRQITPGAGVFQVKDTRQVWIHDLAIEMHPDINGVLGACYFDNPDADGCAFKRSAGVAIYGSQDVCLENLRLDRGTWGILLSDSPQLDAPAHGPTARAFWDDHTDRPTFERFVIYNDLCTPGRANQQVTVRHNVITGTDVAGIAIFNADDSEIRANHAIGNAPSRRRTTDGIKLGCGPVTDTVIAENYLSGNERDGLDAAWAWTETIKDNERFATIEDPPDGPLRDNCFESNVAFDNDYIGIGIKGSDMPEKDAPFHGEATLCTKSDMSRFVRVGDNEVRRNLLLRNGLRQLELNRIAHPEHGCTKAPRPEWMAVTGNVMTGVKPLGFEGANNQLVYNIAFRNNLVLPPATSDGSAIGLRLGDSSRFYDISHNLIKRQLIFHPEAANGREVGNRAPTQSDYDAAFRAIVGPGSYHCEDTDGDLCANACEVHHGRDPLTPNGGPCDCPGSACQPVP